MQTLDLVRVIDLVGHNVDGIAADVRSFTMSGNLRYPEIEPDPKVTELRSVAIETRKGEKWLMWRWRPVVNRLGQSRDCGYSGIRLGAGASGFVIRADIAGRWSNVWPIEVHHG